MHIVQGQRSHLTPIVVRLRVLPKGDYKISKAEVVRLCVLPKGDYIISFLTSSNRVFYPWAMITFHDHVCFPRAMNAFTPDVVRLCVLYKGHDCMPHPMIYHHVCYPNLKMACHT